MRHLTTHETAAMYHFHDRYAAQRGSAIDFFLTLSAHERVFIRDMVDAIAAAINREAGGNQGAEGHAKSPTASEAP